MKFCSKCGATTNWRLPTGDSRHRFVCDTCNFIHYQNPNIVAGCIVYQEDSVLLCKRAIEPRLGFWTLPAGFMENGETTRQAAERETFEETGAKITSDQLFAITNTPQVNHVNIFYLAKLKNNNFHPTDESSEVKLFKKNDIPFEEIAFHTVKAVLENFFRDLKAEKFGMHQIDF
ncbi:MAG: NUDIX hydrolase [Cellvibrionaceae bacterium]|nr:NUDIX hydrolase [Cellvibrionaceae bacterium]